MWTVDLACAVFLNATVPLIRVEAVRRLLFADFLVTRPNLMPKLNLILRCPQQDRRCQKFNYFVNYILLL